LLAFALIFELIDRKRAKLHEAGLFRDLDDLHEYTREVGTVPRPESTERTEVRKQTGAQHAKRHVGLQLRGDLAGAEDACAVREQQDLQHRPRRVGLLALPTDSIPLDEGVVGTNSGITASR